MNIYNDQKVATDRVGKKLIVKNEDVPRVIGMKIEDGKIEDTYLEVARENMRAVELSNRE